MFPTLFLIVAILFVKYVDVEVIVGHFNIVLGEGVPQLLIDGVVGGPVVLHGAPAVNGVFDGACAVVGTAGAGSGRMLAVASTASIQAVMTVSVGAS